MKKICVLIVLSILQGAVRSLFPCLSWSLGGGNLKFTCRIEDLDLPVTFSDPFGRLLGRCTFTGVSSGCVSFDNRGKITSDSITKEIIFTLQYTNDSNIDGNWSCSQGNNVYHTDLSISKGISSSTDLHLSAKIRDPGSPNLITLKCFSCREPYRNSVEFLHNHTSTDNLHYDHISKKCFHIDGECNVDKCSCAPSGNEYTRILKIDKTNDSQYFSCGMRFIDNIKLVTIVKYTTLFFNGMDFTFNGTETEEINWNGGKSSTADISTKQMTSTMTPAVETKDITTEILIGVGIGVAVVVVLILLFTWCVISFGKSKEYKNIKNRSQRKDGPTPTREEGAPLLPLSDGKFEQVITAIKNTQTVSILSETSLLDQSSDFAFNKARWLLVGISLHNILTPTLKKSVENIVSELYSAMKQSHAIDKQSYDNHLTNNPRTSEELNYEAINHNNGCGQRMDMYDYRIKNPVDLSKLFLPTELTYYENFIDVHDPMTLLQVLINIDVHPEDRRSVSKQICTMIRDGWLLCNFDEWNSEQTYCSLMLIVHLLEALQMETNEQARLTEQMQKFKEDATAALDASSRRKIENIKQEIEILIDNILKTTRANSCYKKALTELRRLIDEFDNRIKEQQKQEEENFRKLVFIMEKIAAKVVRKFIGIKLLNSNCSDTQFRNYLETNVHGLYHTWCKRTCCQCESDPKNGQSRESLLTKQQFHSMYDTDGHPVHFKHGQFCLCKIKPKENATLQSVDVTIAQCLVKTLDFQSPDNGKTHALKCMNVLQECRNKLANKGSLKQLNFEQFARRKKEMEEAILGLASRVNNEFRLKIDNAVATLNHQQTVENKPTYFQNILQQYREDLELMIHKDHEARFKKKIDKAGIQSKMASLRTMLTEHKKDVLFAKTDNVRINILKYPEIAKDEGRKTIEVVLQGDIPDNWDEYKMMETVRRMCEQITAGGNVIVKETTLEKFMMILEMLVEALRHEETLKRDIISLFNKILKECNIDTSQFSEINVAVEPLPEHDIDREMKDDEEVTAEIDELKLIKTWNIPEKDALITSIAVVDGDTYLLIDSNNNLLIFFDNERMTDSKDLVNKPWSMVLMDNHTIIISFPDRQEVGIFNLKEKRKSDFRKIDGTLHTMTKKDDSSVLLCTDESGICLYNIALNKLDPLEIEIPDFVPNSDEISYRNDLLYISSRSKEAVFCYDLKGEKKWEFKHPDLKQPTTVSCDLCGNVFVTGYLSNNLFVIYNDGTSHKQLLTKKDHLKLPTFLYFCPKRKCLLIANRDNGFVARYDIVYKRTN